jgi:5-methylcytosine-specific restriction endonuclease McrBC regulatory subunit McrC
MQAMPPVTGNTRVYYQVIISNALNLCKIIVHGDNNDEKQRKKEIWVLLFPGLCANIIEH